MVVPTAQAAQFARPDADVTTGTWTTTPLWQQVDEAIRDDGDLVTSDNNAVNAAALSLSDGTDPQSSTGHTLRYTYRKSASGGHSIDFRMQLRQGYVDETTQGTLVAEWLHTAISDVFTLAEQTLTTGQADAITDYADLQVRFVREGDTGGNPAGRRSAQTSWIEFELPDAPPPMDPPTVTTNAATDVTDASATLNGNLDSLGTAASVDVSFEWGPESAPPFSFETTPEAKTATGAFSAGLTGLDPETTYSFRAKAVGDGTAFGSVLSFTTGAAPWSNTAPSVDQAFANREGGHNLTYQEALTATDPDTNQTLTWTLSTNTTFLALEQANRSAWVNGTPAFTDRDQSYYVNATVDDGGCAGACALTDFLNWTLWINDTAPVLSNPIATDEAGHNISYSRDFDFTDANSDSGIWSLESEATFLSIDQLGTVSGTPAFADRESTFWVEATILDYEGGLSDLVNYTLYVNNSAPTITNPIAEDSGTVDTPYSRDFDFTDPNADGGVWSLDSDAAFLSIDSAGIISGTPDTEGTYYANATLLDYEGGLSDSVNYTLAVAGAGGSDGDGDGGAGTPVPTGLFLHNNDWTEPGLVHFTYSGEGGRSFLWDFGDGSLRSTERDPVHRYRFFLFGQWTATLTACSVTGCETTQQVVTLIDLRAVGFLALIGIAIVYGGLVGGRRWRL